MKLFKKKRVLPLMLTLLASAAIYFVIVCQFAPILLPWAYFHASVTMILGYGGLVLPGVLYFKYDWK